MPNLTSHYDQVGDFYFHFIKKGLAQPQSMFHLAVNAVLELLGDVGDKSICDVACGEGHLSRRLTQLGATVTGVDLSENLLAHAQRQSTGLPITFVRDDAQSLTTLASQAFHAAVCNLALMDIPDHNQTFRAIHRILQEGGRFVFSVLHPCFETPFRVPESQLQLDSVGNFEAFIVRRYAAEGHWNSGGTGLRGTLGAHHRMLSTYLNSLLDAGFRLERLVEPKLPPGDYAELSHQINSHVPLVLVVAAIKEV